MGAARGRDVNGINIAFRVQGNGPPLVLIMGYRLSSAAWPSKFVEALAKNFTVITFDNRGTGQSDKPLTGYALANMARDVAGLLDEIGIESTFVLGYSMGGAIAQEFTRQFPDRVAGLILCATMCGGPRATYADASVVRVMRDLDGFSTEQIARRIWEVTYAPDYLRQNRALAEDQMRRETALPTPLHAADLQFQAFAEFDGSKALSQIRCPTLVLTGDLDRLIRPENSRMLAQLIPGAKLVVIPGGGHRVLWEAVEECTDLIDGFLASIQPPPPGLRRIHAITEDGRDTTRAGIRSRIVGSAAAGSRRATILKRRSRNPCCSVSSRFGDGKPILILAPPFIGSDLVAPAVLDVAKGTWLSASDGRRLNQPDDSPLTGLAQAIDDITRRVRRKAILITHCSGMTRALRAARCTGTRYPMSSSSTLRIRDTDGLRVHFTSSGWPLLHGMVELPRLLRSIGIELIEETKLEQRPSFGCTHDG